MLLHFEVVFVAAGCIAATWWQAGRALGGNTLSWFYTFEWPVFAGIAVVGWWQLIHEDYSFVLARKAERLRRRKMKGVPTIPEFTLADLEALTKPRPLELGPVGSTSHGAGDVGVYVEEVEEDRLAAEAVAADSAYGMTAYNQYLAALKERGHAKTWRNPKGL